MGSVRCLLECDSTSDGREIATLTCHLPNGEHFSVVGDARITDCAVLARASDPEVGFSLKGLFKVAKGVAGLVGGAKVLSLAGKVLSKVAPVMLGPVGIGVSLAMSAASKLTAAKAHAARGDHKSAQALVASAAQDAAQHPDGPAPALAQANTASGKIYALLLAPVAPQGA